MKQLWLLMGGNGAGKSSFYRLMLQPYGLPFVNADSLARLVYPVDPEAHSYDKQRIRQRFGQVSTAELEAIDAGL